MSEELEKDCSSYGIHFVNAILFEMKNEGWTGFEKDNFIEAYRQKRDELLREF